MAFGIWNIGGGGGPIPYARKKFGNENIQFIQYETNTELTGMGGGAGAPPGGLAGPIPYIRENQYHIISNVNSNNLLISILHTGIGGGGGG